MGKICCIEDGDVSSKCSSCPMVLRSACTHRHSRENSAVKESSSFHKREHISLVPSDSSKNQYSLLKGNFCETTEITKDVDQKVFGENSLNVSCAKELHFSQLTLLSDSQNSYIFNNSNHTECSSDYCSANESDINSSESLNFTSNMPSTRRSTRILRHNVRSLSDSDGESDITVEKITRVKRWTLDEKLTRQNIESYKETNSLSRNDTPFLRNNSYSTNSHSSKYTGTSDGDSLHSHFSDSLHIDESSVQRSLFDKFRWFIWRCTYLRIIRCVNFDVWLLSRLSKFQRSKVISILLSSLIFFLVLGAYKHMDSSSLYQPLTSLVDVVKSLIYFPFSFLTYVFSSICTLFTQKAVEERIIESSEEARFSAFLPSLSGFGAVISSWFSSAIDDTKIYTEEASHMDIKAINHYESSKEDMLALNKLKDELRELKSNFQLMEKDKIMYQNLQNDINDLQLKFQAFSETVEILEKDSTYQKEKNTANEKIIAITAEYKDNIDLLKNKLKIIENKLAVYEDLKKCCSKQWSEEDLIANIEKSLVLAFREVVGGEINSKYHFFSEWLNSKFFNHEALMKEINAVLQQQSSYTENKIDFDKVMQVVESTVSKHVDAIKRNLSEFNSFTYSSFSQDLFSEDKVRRIVKEAIMLYDADKTGQVDYALESGGGSVLGTRCSETYVEKYGKISLFGVPFWTYSNSPRTAIQPDVQPGRCWAFKGSQGFLVLQLSATIYPTGFTLEHIPVSLSPAGSIDSAPKNFSVWGLDSERDNKGNLLGEYSYDIHGDPLQYFPAKIPSTKPYNYIELQVHSNHGNMEYTCLYRFRVHGKRVK